MSPAALLVLSLLGSPSPDGAASPPASRAIQGANPGPDSLEDPNSPEDFELLLASSIGWSAEGLAARNAAARQLVQAGAPAADFLLARLSDSPGTLASFGPSLVGQLGAIDSVPLRGKLWEALTDPDFPWRSAAAHSLARTARGTETGAFAAFLEDPLDLVRAAALEGLKAIAAGGETGSTALAELPLRERLGDPSGAVRRRAADLLIHLDQPWAMVWLIEELQRTDAFFDDEDGRTARADALQLLEQHLGEDLGFDPAGDPFDPDNTAALGRLLDRYREASGGTVVSLARVARAGRPLEDIRVGLEVLSSTHGRISLRWDRTGTLFVGRGNALAVELASTDGEALWREVAQALATVPLEQEAGLGDYERIWVLRGERTFTYRVERTSPVRLRGFTQALEALLATLPSEHADGAAGNLAARTRAALTAVAGPLTD